MFLIKYPLLLTCLIISSRYVNMTS